MTREPEDATARGRRERSARYPGAPLSEAIELARFVDDHGLDGTSAESIAASMGFESIKTRTFSARLSAARQFDLLSLDDSGYRLTPLARSLLHPIDPADLPRLRRSALKAPPLYADLLVRLADRKVPEPDRLANLLYHNYQITASAKLPAAEAFVESARFAGALGDDGILHAEGPTADRPAVDAPPPPSKSVDSVPTHVPRTVRAPRDSAGVRFDLRLWGTDTGKVVRVLAPESMSVESFDRLIEALRLHIRIDADRPDSMTDGG